MWKAAAALLAAGAAFADDAPCLTPDLPGLTLGPAVLNVSTNVSKYVAVSSLRCVISDVEADDVERSEAGTAAVAASATVHCSGHVDIDIDDMLPTYNNCVVLSMKTAASVSLAASADGLAVQRCSFRLSNVAADCTSSYDPPLCPLLRTVLDPANRQYGYSDALEKIDAHACGALTSLLTGGGGSTLDAAAAALSGRLADASKTTAAASDLAAALEASGGVLPAPHDVAQALSAALDASPLSASLRSSEPCTCCAPEDSPNPRLRVRDLVRVSVLANDSKLSGLHVESTGGGLRLGSDVEMEVAGEVTVEAGELTDGFAAQVVPLRARVQFKDLTAAVRSGAIEVSAFETVYRGADLNLPTLPGLSEAFASSAAALAGRLLSRTAPQWVAASLSRLVAARSGGSEPPHDEL